MFWNCITSLDYKCPTCIRMMIILCWWKVSWNKKTQMIRLSAPSMILWTGFPLLTTINASKCNHPHALLAHTLTNKSKALPNSKPTILVVVLKFTDEKSNMPNMAGMNQQPLVYHFRMKPFKPFWGWTKNTSSSPA